MGKLSFGATRKVILFAAWIILAMSVGAVATAQAQYTLVATPASAAVGQAVSVNWTANPAGAQDWIAWYRVGDPNTN